jgi:membrane fusion protein, heavy metal efflux system
LAAAPVWALESQIEIDAQQIAHLNIQTGALRDSARTPLLYAPAKVVAPASHERLVTSPQPGLLVQLTANIGDTVKKNQLLAQINSPELVALQRDFLTAANEMNLAERGYNRDKKLLDEGVIADRRWNETETLFLSKQAQANSARQLLQIAGMNDAEINHLQNSGHLNGLLPIRAPMSGVVLERKVGMGARLDMQAPIYLLADLSELWLEINIPQERARQVEIGDQAVVEQANATAVIRLVGQSVNQDNQTVPVRAVLNADAGGLRIGQSVNVQIFQRNRLHGFIVDSAAMAEHQGRNYIFVRNASGFYATEVKVIGKQEHEALVGGPLHGGEEIAVRGAAALKAVWLGLGGGE